MQLEYMEDIISLEVVHRVFQVSGGEECEASVMGLIIGTGILVIQVLWTIL